MSSTLCRYTLQAVAATGTLLLLSYAISADGRSTPAADYGVEQASEEQQTEIKSANQRNARRMRASLSMPYFSFAQSLKPRS